MEDIQIKLAFIWTALMLTYLLGDVIRVFSGDFKSGEIDGRKISGRVWLGIAVVMVLPVIMSVLTLFLGYPLNRWLNVGMAAFFFLFNVIGLPTYPSAFDRFLIAVSLAFNGLTVWLAWNWI